MENEDCLIQSAAEKKQKKKKKHNLTGSSA